MLMFGPTQHVPATHSSNRGNEAAATEAIKLTKNGEFN